MTAMAFAVSAATVLFCGLMWAVVNGDDSQRRMRKRARALRSGRSGGVTSERGAPTAQSLLRTQKRAVPLIEGFAEHIMPRPLLLRERLARSGLDITIGVYLSLTVMVAAAVALVLLFAVHLAWPVAALAGIAAGAWLPHLAVTVLIKRRQRAFLAYFPEAIALMVRAVKSGLPITQGVAIVGRELPNPVGSEFRRISDMIRLGRPPEEVLWETARRLDLADFNFFVISLSIQRETGGNLAETLANLGDLLRGRRQMKLKVKAMSSEARASAFILGSLPFIMFGIISLINPDYAAVLYTDPRGKMLLGGSLMMLVLAITIMTKMIRFEI